MARLGDIYLGGPDDIISNRIFNSGIGFNLNSPSRISSIQKFDDEKWEIEIKEGHQSIIARCIDVLKDDEIIKSGFKFCQIAIDMISVTFAEEIYIPEPSRCYILLYNVKGVFHLKQINSCYTTYDSSVTIEVRDKNGNVKPQPKPPEPTWSPALRYYRLSQNSPSLYEAYRNLFLSFEYALTDLFPRRIINGKPERWNERNRYKSALVELDKIIPLKNYVPANEVDPAEYFCTAQYDNIRCKLFHAKSDPICKIEMNITPFEEFNPKNVQDAYENLMRLTKEILIKQYHVNCKTGVVTNIGFKMTMMNSFAHAIFVCNDKTPLDEGISKGQVFPITIIESADIQEQIQNQLADLSNKVEELISPLKSTIQMYTNLTCNWDYDPGVVSISLNLSGTELEKIDMIHRISIFYMGNLLVSMAALRIFYIRDGLSLVGVDQLEITFFVSLANKGYPKKYY